MHKLCKVYNVNQRSYPVTHDVGGGPLLFNNTQKGIKTDGLQGRKFWGLAKLAIVVPHRRAFEKVLCHTDLLFLVWGSPCLFQLQGFVLTF